MRQPNHCMFVPNLYGHFYISWFSANPFRFIGIYFEYAYYRYVFIRFFPVKRKKKFDTIHPGDVRQTKEGCHYNVLCIVSKKQ